jgi:hypothetical protein
VALGIGRWCERRFGWGMGSPYVAIVVGVGVIQIWTFVGHLFDLGGWPLEFFAFMFLLLGVVLQYVVWTVGFGAALLTRFGTSNGTPSSAEAALPPPPPSPSDDEPFFDETSDAGESDWETDEPAWDSPAREWDSPEPEETAQAVESGEAEAPAAIEEPVEPAEPSDPGESEERSGDDEDEPERES